MRITESESFGLFPKSQVVHLLQLAFGVVGQRVRCEIHRVSFGLALNMFHKNESVLESLQLLIKGLSLTRVVDYVSNQLGVRLNCILQILAQP